MSKTFKKIYKGFRSKYVSGRFSGFDHFKTKPFGLKGWNYYWRTDRDTGKMREDAYSEVNNSSKRQELKRNLRDMINEID